MEAARLAHRQEVIRLCELWQRARDEAAPARGGAVFVAREARHGDVRNSFLGDLDADHSIVLVGTLDDVVVGYGVARTEELEPGWTHGVITDLYVEPEAREVAVGEVLIDGLLDWCREQACRGIDAYALPGDRHTKNFFEAHGFTARLLVVHRRSDR